MEKLSCLWTGEVHMIKMDIPPKAIYKLNEITIKNLVQFSTEVEKLPLTFIWQHKRLRVARTILNTKYFAGNTIIWSFVIVQKNQHGADIKIDTLINGITLKTVTWSHTLIYTWHLPKTPDIYNGEKTSSTSGIEKTGQLQVEHWN